MAIQKKLIDVSKHNGTIDWNLIKNQGIDGVIIRAGFGKHISQKDPCFEANYLGAKNAGLHIGSYWYSYALSPEEAKLEATAFMSVIKDKAFDLPIFLDIEDKSQISLSKSVCTEIVTAFMDSLENAGYFSGVYSYDSFFYDNLHTSIQSRYATWVARVENVLPKFVENWGIHQFSWKGILNGINGNVDMNNCIIDYPTIIKSKGLNNHNTKPKTYSITAAISNLSKENADKISDECKKLGMITLIKTL